jgi:hypothetical protein
LLSRLLEALGQFTEENPGRLAGSAGAGLQRFAAKRSRLIAGGFDGGLEGRSSLIEGTTRVIGQAAQLGGNLPTELSRGIANRLRERVADLTEIARDLVEVLAGELRAARTRFLKGEFDGVGGNGEAIGQAGHHVAQDALGLGGRGLTGAIECPFDDGAAQANEAVARAVELLGGPAGEPRDFGADIAAVLDDAFGLLTERVDGGRRVHGVGRQRNGLRFTLETI